MKKLIIPLAAFALCAGCMTGNQAQPSTEIHGYLGGKPFKAIFPKDDSVESAHIRVETNGTVDITLTNLNAKNNPVETAAAYKGQVDMFNAGANAVNSGIETGIKAAAAIPK